MRLPAPWNRRVGLLDYFLAVDDVDAFLGFLQATAVEVEDYVHGLAILALDEADAC